MAGRGQRGGTYHWGGVQKRFGEGSIDRYFFRNKLFPGTCIQIRYNLGPDSNSGTYSSRLDLPEITTKQQGPGK